MCIYHLQKLAAQPQSTRMSLRSFRSSPLVPMETSSSSSDDSCDSFGSDGGFANTVKMKYQILLFLSNSVKNIGRLCNCGYEKIQSLNISVSCCVGYMLQLMILSVSRGAAWDWEGRWQRNQRCSRLHQRRIHATGLRRMWSTVRWKPWWVIRKKKNTIATHFRTSSTVLEGSSNHKLYILSESGLSKTRPQVQWLQDCHDFPHQEDGQEETCIGTSSSH